MSEYWNSPHEHHACIQCLKYKSCLGGKGDTVYNCDLLNFQLRKLFNDLKEFKKMKPDNTLREIHNAQFEDDPFKDCRSEDYEPIYTWNSLQDNTPEELNSILENLQEKLYSLQKEKLRKINDILYKQEQIKKLQGTFK